MLLQPPKFLPMRSGLTWSNSKELGRKNKLEIRTGHTALTLYAFTHWGLGHAVTFTLDLLTQTWNILVPKCINAINLEKFSPLIFEILRSALTRPNSTFSSMQYPTVTLNFDILIPKLEAVHPCPKTHKYWKFGENTSNTFQDILLITFRMHRHST